MANNDLDVLYKQYLSSRMKPVDAQLLADALRDAGLTLESRGLQTYIEHGFRSEFTIEEGIW